MHSATDFFNVQAQTTPHPLAIEVARASGSYIYDTNQKAYLDFVAGVSACTLGHCHPKLVKAVQLQAETYMHVMVYGEFITQPAVDLCQRLGKTTHFREPMTYLVNSGTEAMEAALKLARRVTGKQEIIAMHDAYHGNTMGSMSLMDYEERLAPFRPLLSGVQHIKFNDRAGLDKITEATAAIVLESIQGGAGFILPQNEWLKELQEKASQCKALLIVDEIQPGIARTGTFWAYQAYDFKPDMVITGKGLGGGLPIGALIAERAHMLLFSKAPKLGHITTFGGNPVVAAAANAVLKEVKEQALGKAALEKEKLFRAQLKHPLIKEIRGKGLMLALILEKPEFADALVLKALQQGLILFWLLFEKRAVRITPPLSVSKQEIIDGCAIILSVLEALKEAGN
ncbi:MAG: aminotransferase class III-fold pyridoxal phosphate-dependent enzyme [Flavobacteriaceae bacterium]|nr:aminotransferase class III-fold pyridoxal phosphate-dependent enzyme [Flavobacteriaceae bacterium]